MDSTKKERKEEREKKKEKKLRKKKIKARMAVGQITRTAGQSKWRVVICMVVKRTRFSFYLITQQVLLILSEPIVDGKAFVCFV